MSTILEAINTRRSVRKWINKEVSDNDINDILETAMNAPSAGNEQAWQFVLITDKEILQKYSSFNSNVVFIKNAQAAILVCGDKSLQKYDGYYVHDCCAATENILLAIHAKGLGGVWGNVFPDVRNDIRKLFNLPEHIVPFSVIPFGHAADTPAYHSRYDKKRIHYNNW